MNIAMTSGDIITGRVCSYVLHSVNIQVSWNILWRLMSVKSLLILASTVLLDFGSHQDPWSHFFFFWNGVTSTTKGAVRLLEVSPLLLAGGGTCGLGLGSVVGLYCCWSSPVLTKTVILGSESCSTHELMAIFFYLTTLEIVQLTLHSAPIKERSRVVSFRNPWQLMWNVHDIWHLWHHVADATSVKGPVDRKANYPNYYSSRFKLYVTHLPYSQLK
jgi:hypothetical protein